MKIALVQVNATVGDLEGNVKRCVDMVGQAARQNPDLIVLPEMIVPGYPPRDILYDASFVEATQEANRDLASQLKSYPPTLFGSFLPSGQTLPSHPSLYNVAYLAKDGDLHRAAIKRLLPVYDVFYEPRWFIAGEGPSPLLNIGGKSIGVIICEDMWDEDYPIHPGADLASADLLVCLSASPYRAGILDQRIYHAKRQNKPVAFVNLVGATDELIFDGRSFMLNKEGAPVELGPSFAEGITIADTEDATSRDLSESPSEEELFRAVSFGLREFAVKNRLARAVVGLSGGIDSAVTAIVATEALGKENVTAVAIPSRYTDSRSTKTAQELAGALGIDYEVVELDTLHKAAEETLAPLDGTAAENIQARLRMLILMSRVNQRGGFVVNTSNKTELALGYSTLYGDMAGAISPLGDLTKVQVIAMAEWLHVNHTAIPTFIRERPPSAELKPDQVDPFDYARVSPTVEALVQADQTSAAMRAAEHKRWQMGVILKVSERAFGTGRMFPITRS